MNLLRTVGRKIFDSENKEIMLRGTCIGGWMNMENFINGYPGAEHQLRAVMQQIMGTSKAQFFFNRLLDYFFTEDDIVYLKSLGMNVVRLPLNYRHFESDENPFVYFEEGFKRLDSILALCKKHGMYAILDLHAVQGWQNTDWHCDNNSRHSLFWHNKHFQDRFIALWEEISHRYKNHLEVAGYNIMNEPLVNVPFGRYDDSYTPDWPRMNSIYKRAILSIRKIDSDHIIFIEGDYFSSRFEGLEQPPADNLVYSSHNYTPWGFGPGVYPDPQKEWTYEMNRNWVINSEAFVFCQKNNVPLWCGEFGSIYNGAKEEIPSRLQAINDQIEIFNSLDVNWTTWTYKDVGTMGLTMVNPNSEYLQRINHLLKSKSDLKCDQWQFWLPRSKADDLIHELSMEIQKAMHDPDIPAEPNERYFKTAVTACYAAGLMQYPYAKLFKDMSEEQIDSILQAFHFKNCIVNKGLESVLRSKL